MWCVARVTCLVLYKSSNKLTVIYRNAGTFNLKTKTVDICFDSMSF